MGVCWVCLVIRSGFVAVWMDGMCGYFDVWMLLVDGCLFP